MVRACFVIMGLMGLALSIQEPRRQGPQQIRIGSAALKAWSLMYREFKTEFLTCAYGHEVDGVLQMKFVVLAEIKPSQATRDSIPPPIYCVDISGPDSLVGYAHSHPSGVCGESWRDLEAFVNSKLGVSIIVCGQNKIAVLVRGNTPERAPICTFDPEGDSGSLALECTHVRPDSGSNAPAGSTHQ